jgi:hypothetical protein
MRECLRGAAFQAAEWLSSHSRRLRRPLRRWHDDLSRYFVNTTLAALACSQEERKMSSIRRVPIHKSGGPFSWPASPPSPASTHESSWRGHRPAGVFPLQTKMHERSHFMFPLCKPSPVKPAIGLPPGRLPTFDNDVRHTIACKCTLVNILIPRWQPTRAGIFIVLAALVALLGAAAKHSLFDGTPHHCYLSKAVKMAGAPVTPDTASQLAQCVAAPIAEISLAAGEQPVFPAPPVACFTPVSLSSPPLRA